MQRRFYVLLALIAWALPGEFSPAVAQSVTVKVNYTFHGEDLHTGEQIGPVTWAVAGALSGGGRVQDSYEGRAGRLRNAGGREEKLGGGRWQVAGPHQLRRVVNWPNSLTIVTVTVQGSSCQAQVESRLKPGKTFYVFRRLVGGMRAFRTARYSVIDCTIG